MTNEQFGLIDRVIQILKARPYMTPDIALHLDREIDELRLDLELREAQAEVEVLREKARHWREMTAVYRKALLS